MCIKTYSNELKHLIELGVKYWFIEARQISSWFWTFRAFLVIFYDKFYALSATVILMYISYFIILRKHFRKINEPLNAWIMQLYDRLYCKVRNSVDRIWFHELCVKSARL